MSLANLLEGIIFYPTELLRLILGREKSELSSSVEGIWNLRGFYSFRSESLLLGNKLDRGLVMTGA